MKKYIIGVISIISLCIIFKSEIYVNAAVQAGFMLFGSPENVRFMYYDSGTNVYEHDGYIELYPVNYSSDSYTINDALYMWNNHIYPSRYNTSNRYNSSSQTVNIILSGSLGIDLPSNIKTLEDYLNPPKSWYDIVWDTLKDYFQNPVPFEWFTNLIDKVFGNDNNGGTISENVTISAPTIAPTPTPIPYSTMVIPKTDIITGDTVYETNYYYVNPSGTPIITSSPPTNTPSSGGGGGGSTEYYPINGDPYSLPYLDWLSNVDIGENDYNGIDSIGDGLSSIDNIGSEYSDGMSAVQDSTGTLPSSWLLLIGIAAAIPLLAGIISRFLGG